MKLEQARRIAMSLPSVTEEPHFQYTSFRVAGKIFATAPPDGEYLHVFVDEEDRQLALALEPEPLAILNWGKRVVGLRVALSKAKSPLVRKLLQQAWSRKAPKKATVDAIDFYANAQSAKHAAICRMLRVQFDTALPKATSKIWHAVPVWFVGESPIVGYKATPKFVNLLFWNGQSFNEPALTAAGKFKAAQIRFSDPAEIDLNSLRRWLKKSAKLIWDYRSD
jgi:hypothetical protein